MRVRLPGIHKVRRSLKSGGFRMHYYAWRGGPKIISEVGTPEFIAEYHQHYAAKKGTFSRDHLGYMIERYLVSPEGKKGVRKTVSERKRYATIINNRFGTLPIRALEGQKIRQLLYEWRDTMSDKPRTADELWRQFNRIVKWGQKRGYVQNNPLANYESLYSSNRADVIWHPDDIRKMLASCNRETGWVYRAVIHLGTRMDDLRKLKWSDIKPDKTVYKPSKGSKYNRIATIEHTPFFRALLSELPRTSIYVFTNTHGLPWGIDALKSADRRARHTAELEHLHFHDLRGTAATIKASQGDSALMIAGALGWSIHEVETMLNRYVSWNNVNDDWSWAVNAL